jgi:hypothetical protein
MNQKFQSSLVGMVAVIAIIAATGPFYAGKTVAILIVVPLFALLTCWNPHLAVFFLFAAIPFFGNHPGGRFMELFPLLSFLWLAVKTSKDGLRVNRKFLIWYGLFLFVLILPLVLNPNLFVAASYYKNGLFHLLNANEHSPLYPFQQTVWLALIPLLVQAARPCMRSVIAGITAGFALTVAAGVIEILSPSFAVTLDRLHIFLDGYVDRNPPHSIAAGFHPFKWLTHSPNSLFWNRSWHAVFIIASLPFVSLFVHERLKKMTQSRKWIIAAGLILLTLYLLAIGARGALFAWSAFLIVMAAGWLLNRLKSRMIYWLPHLAIGAALLFQIVVPLFIVFTDQGRTELRYPQFAAAFLIFAMFPIAGGGTESYGYYNNFFLRAAGEAALHGTSHNQLLQIATGNGLIGVFFYSAMLIGLAGQIRKCMITGNLIAEQDKPIPLLLITAGMTSALVYGSVQEWNYLRPTILIWAMVFYLPELISSDAGWSAGALAGQGWHVQTQRTEARLQHEEKNRWWILIPVVILVLAFSYRSLPGFEFSQDADQAITEQAAPQTDDSNSEDSFKAFEPVAPLQGVEYIDPDRFVILQGESHILLPEKLEVKTITPLKSDVKIALSWSISKEREYLRIRCYSQQGYFQGDIDARRLCAEVVIPQSTNYFRSIPDPVLYLERMKNRGLF